MTPWTLGRVDVPAIAFVDTPPTSDTPTLPPYIHPLASYAAATAPGSALMRTQPTACCHHSFAQRALPLPLLPCSGSATFPIPTPPYSGGGKRTCCAPLNHFAALPAAPPLLHRTAVPARGTLACAFATPAHPTRVPAAWLPAVDDGQWWSGRAF